MKSCDISQASLHVQAENTAAIRLYQSMGFRILCRIKDYYNIPEISGDALWMRRDMSSKRIPTGPELTGEMPLIAPSIPTGPWPFGLSFEMFFLFVLGLATLITMTVVNGLSG